MNWAQRKLYLFRGWLTNAAHQPGTPNWLHDGLEFIAYRVVDPLVWL